MLNFNFFNSYILLGNILNSKHNEKNEDSDPPNKCIEFP